MGYSIRQILRLDPERRWLMNVQKSGKLDNRQVKPVLLATVYAMLADQRQESQLSALSLRSVLDGVAARLDEGREISRYMIGLLVFLGLLGTFWGLLQTIGAVGAVVGSIDTASTDFDAMMQQLKGGLDAPLSGMSTAFVEETLLWKQKFLQKILVQGLYVPQAHQLQLTKLLKKEIKITRDI